MSHETNAERARRLLKDALGAADNGDIEGALGIAEAATASLRDALDDEDEAAA